jgi:hypothetical protein
MFVADSCGAVRVIAELADTNGVSMRKVYSLKKKSSRKIHKIAERPRPTTQPRAGSSFTVVPAGNNGAKKEADLTRVAQ